MKDDIPFHDLAQNSLTSFDQTPKITDFGSRRASLAVRATTYTRKKRDPWRHQTVEIEQRHQQKRQKKTFLGKSTDLEKNLSSWRTFFGKSSLLTIDRFSSNHPIVQCLLFWVPKFKQRKASLIRHSTSPSNHSLMWIMKFRNLAETKHLDQHIKISTSHELVISFF